MSRSGYIEDCDDPLVIGRWRQAVRRAIEGKRGQSFLRETLAALDAMPVKELAADSLVTSDGEFCTLGVVGAARDIDMTDIDPEDAESVSAVFGIAKAMVKEIVYENDECGWRYEERPWVARSTRDHAPHYRVEETPAERWARMREWVLSNIADKEGISA